MYEASEVPAELSAAPRRLAGLGLRPAAGRGPRSETVQAVQWCVPGVRALPSPGPAPELVAVQRAVDDLQACAPSGRTDDVSALLVLAERLRGSALTALAEMDDVGGHLATGDATAASWLPDQAVLSDRAARSTVALARQVRQDLPRLGELLTAGRTTMEHVRAVAEQVRGLDREVVAESEPALCELVAAADPATVRAVLEERADAVRPELGREAARRAHERRGFYADDVAGRVALGGSLDVEDGQVLLLGLDLACEADRAAGDARTLPQRRADVLVQWARQATHALTGPGDGLAQDAHTVRTHLLITCTPEQLAGWSRHSAPTGATGQTASACAAGAARPASPAVWPCPAREGDPLLSQEAAAVLLAGRAATGTPPRVPSPALGALLPHEALRRLACDATVSLVARSIGAQDSPVGSAPLYVGRSARTVTGAQFKALVVRDRHCVVRGCRRRPAQCQAHHVRHWLDGGATDLDNLVLLCHAHHHDHHDRGHDLSHRDGRRLTAAGWHLAPP